MKRKTTLFCFITMLALEALLPLFAQEEAGTGSLAEIVVTARRTAEKLQEVPDQVTVFTAKDLADAGVHDYQGFADLTPDFAVYQYSRAGTMQFSSRGFATPDNGEAPVAVVVDGVEAASLEDISQDLLGLQSIEVVRGPQGAVYGRGAIGGAVLITTKRPTNDWEGSIDTRYTSVIDEKAITTEVSGPIIRNKLLFSLDTEWSDKQGFIRQPDVPYSETDGYNCDKMKNRVAFVGRLLYEPEPNLDLDFKANVWRGEGGQECSPVTTSADPFRIVDYLVVSDPGFDDGKYTELSENLRWTTNYGTLTAVPSYQDRNSDAGIALEEQMPAPLGRTVLNDKVTRAFNLNSYFASPVDRLFQWQVGSFIQLRQIKFLESYAAPNYLPPVAPFRDMPERGVAWAGFVTALYNITAKLQPSFSLRYDQDRRTTFNVFTPNSYEEHVWSAVEPKGQLKYNWADAFMTYVSVGRGFRSGLFNRTSALAEGYPLYVKEELATNYEVGFKSTMLDGELLLNGAFFHTDVSNMQTYFFDPISYSSVTVNIPSVRMNGEELELIADPLEGLEVRASVSVIDDDIMSPHVIGLTGGFSGKFVPKIYKYQGSLIVQYSRPAFGSWDATARFTFRDNGPIAYDLANQYTFHSSTDEDLRLSLASEHTTFTLSGNNLGNERAPTVLLPNALGPGLNYIFPNVPRNFGVEARYDF
jgi:iron complex outermembrane recepter protein